MSNRPLPKRNLLIRANDKPEVFAAALEYYDFDTSHVTISQVKTPQGRTHITLYKDPDLPTYLFLTEQEQVDLRREFGEALGEGNYSTGALLKAPRRHYYQEQSMNGMETLEPSLNELLRLIKVAPDSAPELLQQILTALQELTHNLAANLPPITHSTGLSEDLLRNIKTCGAIVQNTTRIVNELNGTVTVEGDIYVIKTSPRGQMQDRSPASSKVSTLWMPNTQICDTRKRVASHPAARRGNDAWEKKAYNQCGTVSPSTIDFNAIKSESSKKPDLLLNALTWPVPPIQNVEASCTYAEITRGFNDRKEGRSGVGTPIPTDENVVAFGKSLGKTALVWMAENSASAGYIIGYYAHLLFQASDYFGSLNEVVGVTVTTDEGNTAGDNVGEEGKLNEASGGEPSIVDWGAVVTADDVARITGQAGAQEQARPRRHAQRGHAIPPINFRKTEEQPPGGAKNIGDLVAEPSQLSKETVDALHARTEKIKDIMQPDIYTKQTDRLVEYQYVQHRYSMGASGSLFGALKQFVPLVTKTMSLGELALDCVLRHVIEGDPHEPVTLVVLVNVALLFAKNKNLTNARKALAPVLHIEDKPDESNTEFFRRFIGCCLSECSEDIAALMVPLFPSKVIYSEDSHTYVRSDNILFFVTRSSLGRKDMLRFRDHLDKQLLAAKDLYNKPTPASHTAGAEPVVGTVATIPASSRDSARDIFSGGQQRGGGGQHFSRQPRRGPPQGSERYGFGTETPQYGQPQRYREPSPFPRGNRQRRRNSKGQGQERGYSSERSGYESDDSSAGHGYQREGSSHFTPTNVPIREVVERVDQFEARVASKITSEITKNNKELMSKMEEMMKGLLVKQTKP